MKRVLHALLVILAGAIWVISRIFYWVSSRLVVLADEVHPEARWGNCWSFAVARYHKHGGYVCERPAVGGARMFGFKIPHAVWLREIPQGAEIQHTSPVKRRNGWLVLAAFYFRYRVVTHETNR